MAALTRRVKGVAREAGNPFSRTDQSPSLLLRRIGDPSLKMQLHNVFIGQNVIAVDAQSVEARGVPDTGVVQLI